MKFAQLGLAEPILRAVAAEGYEVPTPIQFQSIPHVLAGSDLLGCAQTGTGKTAAFALPILDRLAAKLPPSSMESATPSHATKHAHNNGHNRHRKPTHAKTQASQAHAPRRLIRAVVVCPTRELAVQIGEGFKAYGRFLPLRHAVIFGGVSQHHQVRALQAGVDTVIATPGRLLDLMQQGFVDLGHVQIMVLDEADRMLDMGFIHDIRRILKVVPKQRQTLLFSATMPSEIRALADSILHDPVSVKVNPVASTVETIAQSVYHVQRRFKIDLLTHVLKRDGVHRTLVFTRTKRGADKVVRSLNSGGIRAEAIHGNKSQNARSRALAAFKSKSPPVLVATDIASRGIDVDGVTHVINYDIPHEAETYVHRIGRTARAGASGVAISFCDPEERGDLKAIERLTKTQLAIQNDMPALQAAPALSHAAKMTHDDRDTRGHRPKAHRNHLRGGHRTSTNSPAHHTPRASRAKHATHAGHASSGSKPAHGNRQHQQPTKKTGFGQRGRGRGRNGSGKSAW